MLLAVVAAVAALYFLGATENVTTLVPAMIAGLVVIQFLDSGKPRPTYRVDGDKLRFGVQGAYPINQMYRIRRYPAAGTSSVLKIWATDMDTHKTPALMDSEKLIDELISKNPSIEVVGE